MCSCGGVFQLSLGMDATSVGHSNNGIRVYIVGVLLGTFLVDSRWQLIRDKVLLHFWQRFTKCIHNSFTDFALLTALLFRYLACNFNLQLATLALACFAFVALPPLVLQLTTCCGACFSVLDAHTRDANARGPSAVADTSLRAHNKHETEAHSFFALINSQLISNASRVVVIVVAVVVAVAVVVHEQPWKPNEHSGNPPRPHEAKAKCVEQFGLPRYRSSDTKRECERERAGQPKRGRRSVARTPKLTTSSEIVCW